MRPRNSLRFTDPVPFLLASVLNKDKNKGKQLDLRIDLYRKNWLAKKWFDSILRKEGKARTPTVIEILKGI